MHVINKIALALVIIGALNWGLVGLFEFDLVAALFGEMSALSRLVYTLVGISGLWLAISRLFVREVPRANTVNDSRHQSVR